MVGEPYFTNTRIMDCIIKTNLDGNLMTTLAGSEDLIVGRNIEGMDRIGVNDRRLAIVEDSVEALSSSTSLPSSSPSLLSSSSSPLSSPSSLSSTYRGTDSAFRATRRKMMKEEMERKETGKEGTERKEMERKEMERKEMERKEMERKEMEMKETERKERAQKRKAMKEELERKETERKVTERKEMERKEMERKEMEGKELEGREMKGKETEETEGKEGAQRRMEKKETERKETIRKEMERKETEKKELEKKEVEREEMKVMAWFKELERKELERREMERKETEWKESEREVTLRKEMERKKTDRKEMEKKERQEMEKRRMERKETERKEIERTEMERKEIERKVMDKKEMERKELERKETERKEMERKETEKCVTMIKEGTTELVTRLFESERENAGLKEEIRRLKSSLHLCIERLSKADAAVKIAQSTMMGLLTSEGNALSPLLREESSSLPPLPQRINRNSITSGNGDRISSVVQSPPPMVNRSFEGVETSRETYKCGSSQEGVMSGSETEWKLVDRGRRRKNRSPPPLSDTTLRCVWRDLSPPPLLHSGKDPSNVSFGTDVEVDNNRVERCSPIGRQPKSRTPRPPLSSAVAIVGCVDGFSYAAALKSAREHIDLEALGIKKTNVRKTANGGLLIEVLEEDSRAKAEELGTRIREVLGDSAKVSCPSGKKREVRVTGFDVSVSAVEIVRVFSNFGGCPLTDVRVGLIRTLNNGRGIARVQLPAVAAAKLVDMECVRLGWTMARVELAETRPLQCYRCWRFGHVQSSCRGLVDRRDACYRCGQSGHRVSACHNAVRCVICHDAGLEAVHRLGGPHCGSQVQQQQGT